MGSNTSRLASRDRAARVSSMCLVGLLAGACADRTAVSQPPSAPTPPPPTSTPHSDTPGFTSIHTALGVPVDNDPSDDHLMDKGAYALSYNPHKRVPNWVSWELNTKYLGDAKRQDDFRADDALPSEMEGPKLTDYKHSGYDRGHMCPSAERTSTKELNSLTFLLTNMQPQLHKLNGGPWKGLETYERGLAKAEGKQLYIVAGGIFGPQPLTIGSGVAVPEANYKIVVVLEPGQGPKDVTADTRVVAVIMPNDESAGGRKWTEFLVSIDEAERRTGYEFLSEVDTETQRAIEARVATVEG